MSHFKRKKTNDFAELFRGIMLAHLILLLHVLLLVCMGGLVIFFQGVINYMPLFLIGGLLLVSGMFFYIFRRLKAEGKSLRDIINSPIFSGKSVEINLLGGLASIKIDSRGDNRTLSPREPAAHIPLSEVKTQTRIIELPEISRNIEPPAVDNMPERKIFKWKN